MSKYRRDARVDREQSGIVEELRKIPGVTVEPGHDDLLIGYRGRNYWIELKDPDTVSKKLGVVRQSKIKESQHKLLETWRGQYNIVWSLEQILEIIGVTAKE